MPEDEEEMDSDARDFAWRFVTEDSLLSTKECDLLYANLAPSASAADVTIYDGINTLGVKVVALQASTKTNLEFRPRKSIYCRRGLYIDVGSNVTGLLVQFRVR